MKLHYQTYLEHHGLHSDLAPVLIIPGLFGSTGNWRGFAKKLAQYRPVIVVDQRNHGQSPHSSDNAYADLVADIVELLDDLELPVVTLCGHSMGGKTAMVFALTQPERLEQLIVLDIAPIAYAHSHAPILQALMSLDLSLVASRSEVEQRLTSAIPDKSTRLFIMLSLVKVDGRFQWRLNLDALYANLPFIAAFPEQNPSVGVFDRHCLFIKGADSDYIDEKGQASIRKLFPAATIQAVPAAGHWLHVEQQDSVVEQIVRFIEK